MKLKKERRKRIFMANNTILDKEFAPGEILTANHMNTLIG
jgi:hypothetical protein